MHDGHRERMRSRFLKDTELTSFAPHEALEMLLFYALPRGDTNALAHALLKKFGTLSNLFEASTEDICSVDGIGISCALLIKLAPQITRMAMLRERGVVLSSIAAAAEFIRPVLLGKPVENVYVFCLSNRYELKHYELISRGTIDSAAIYSRDVASCALRLNSNKVILAHNHPGGDAQPSLADFNSTKVIRLALGALGIQLVDHLVFSDKNYYSFALHTKNGIGDKAGELRAAQFSYADSAGKINL